MPSCEAGRVITPADRYACALGGVLNGGHTPPRPLPGQVIVFGGPTLLLDVFRDQRQGAEALRVLTRPTCQFWKSALVAAAVNNGIKWRMSFGDIPTEVPEMVTPWAVTMPLWPPFMAGATRIS